MRTKRRFAAANPPTSRAVTAWLVAICRRTSQNSFSTVTSGACGGRRGRRAPAISTAATKHDVCGPDERVVRIIRCPSKSLVQAARSTAEHGLPDVCNGSHAASKADAKVFVVSTSNVCFLRNLSIDIISLVFLDGASQPAKSLTSSTSPLSVMSASKTSANGCWRLNAAPF